MESLSGPGKCVPVTTSLEKRLLILVALLVVIGMTLIISIIHLNQSTATYETPKTLKGPSMGTDICFTPTCISEAANLLKSVNTSIDPCTDFYSFVCGNWIKNNYLVSSLESQFTKMATTITLRIKEILEMPEKEQTLSPNKQKMTDFYRACMNKSYRDDVGAVVLVHDIDELGGWPLIDEKWKASSFDWADLMIRLFKKGYISDMLLTIKVDVNSINTTESLLKVDVPSLGLIKRHFYGYKFLLNSYRNVIFNLAKLLRDDIGDEKSLVEIEKALNIENAIVDMMDYDAMENEDIHYMTLEELEYFIPKIPWKKLFLNLLPNGIVITNFEKIMVKAAYIGELNYLLEEMDDVNGRTTLANYMFYRVVFNAANYLSKEFHSLTSELFETDKLGPPAPWEVCAKITLEFFPLPLTASYAERYSDNRTKVVLGMMVENIRNSLTDDIKSADWLDAKTKSNALWKVKNIKATIGYPDEILNDDNLNRYYKNVKITGDHFENVKGMTTFRLQQRMQGLHKKRNRSKWFDEDDLLTANAYYVATENIILIPVGVLQDNVFAADRPNYINYGSLGSIVGHELTHAFDSDGSLYDAEGNYRNWWSTESMKNFTKKTACYERQYNNYYVPEVRANVSGSQTLSENIADNGGLKAAYYAYNKLLTEMGSEKSLPGLHYNEKQMFWIAFASVWCKKQTIENVQYMMKYGSHTLEKFRVIGSLSNMEEFSEDFNCKLNSTMNPASKCSLWN